MSRPAIGVTLGPADEPDFMEVRDDYVRAVERAGGLPLLLASGDPGDAAELLGRVDALLLTGGADIEPSLYGAARHPTVTRTLPERDAFEIAMVREALGCDLPLLAICRGHELLNVATGGTLVQDLPSEWPGVSAHDPDVERWQTCHDVEILPGTRLREILGVERVAVNSFHHQAVRDLGRGLILSALSPTDRVIEGVEMPDRRFVLGVQWHPESFWDRHPSFQSLFEALVSAAREGRA